MSRTQKNSLFITGASSFVGRHLIRHLIRSRQFDQLIACSRDEAGLRDFLGADAGDSCISYQYFDLLKPALFEDMLRKHQAGSMIHLAALARVKHGEEDPALAIQTNVAGTIKLLQAAERSGVRRFLFASSNLAREAISVTGMTKFLIETYIQQLPKTFKAFSYRLPNVIDSQDSVSLVFKRLIAEGKHITITHPDMSRKFISAEANARQMLWVLEQGTHADIFINNMPSMKITDLAREMIEESGRKLHIEYIGMRPGEKISELNYEVEDISSTPQPDLFVLKEKKIPTEKLKRVFSVLENKCANNKDIRAWLQQLNKSLLIS